MKSLTRGLTANPELQALDTLRLVWQDPSTRRFIEVGQLTDLGQGKYGFEYTSGAKTDGFFSLSEFPDLDRPYICDTFPAFFANRVMSSHRANYDIYMGWLKFGIADVPTPMEILARTGGGRATDTFHVVDSFRLQNGKQQGDFFASGISHIPDVDDRLSGLHSGDILTLRDEPSNPANPRAILLDASRERKIGWVPDWLVDEVHGMRESSAVVTVTVSQVNLDAPPHLRLLCHLEASRNQ